MALKKFFTVTMLHTAIRLNLFEKIKETNEHEVNLKICGILYVIKTCTDRRIKPHQFQLSGMVVYCTLTVMMLHNGYDTVMRLNIFDTVK